MTDHDHLSNTPDHSNDPSNDPGADERIDALARAAAGELRRPAPVDGIVMVQRAKRRRQAAQLGGAGVAAVAILAVGALAIGGGDAGPTVVPATVSTIESPDTPTPDTTVGPSPTVTEVTGETLPPPESPPLTDPPDTPTSAPPNGSRPEFVYAATSTVAGDSGVQLLIDPTTGEVVDEQPLDSDVSRAAQDELLGRYALAGAVREASTEWITTDWVAGDVTFSVESLPSEVSDLAFFSTATRERFDRCGQGSITIDGAPGTSGVLGPDGALTSDDLVPSGFPAEVRSVAVSPDGQWIVTASGECPEGGTLVDVEFADPVEVIVQVFATTLDAPGVVVASGLPSFELAGLTFSGDGRFLAVETFSDPGFRFFEVASGDEITLFADDCSAGGTKWSRFIGPWLGETSAALTLSCGDGQRLLVRDLATDEELSVRVPDASGFATVDVARDGYQRPSETWFTICAFSVNGCWIGQGNGDLVQVPGTQEASFLPLGFVAGG